MACKIKLCANIVIEIRKNVEINNRRDLIMQNLLAYLLGLLEIYADSNFDRPDTFFWFLASGSPPRGSGVTLMRLGS